MTTMELNAELFRQLSIIAEDESLMRKAVIAMRMCGMNFGSTCGMLCGSMANPMALNYVNDSFPGNDASVSYATVYPLGMFMRVVISQVVLMLFL